MHVLTRSHFSTFLPRDSGIQHSDDNLFVDYVVKMDFGRALEKKDDLVARSNIRVLPEAQQSSPLSLDDRLVKAANQASINLFGSAEYTCTNFPEQTLPQSSTIQPDDLVVVFESFDNLSFVYVKTGGVFSNRNGDFSHDSWIGQSWGAKVRSTSHKGFGFVYLLKPTPELWARSLIHRTQIIHELDASMIIYQLWLKPNMTLVESGTGSGALSHAALRTLAPHGHLHTFEFHQDRFKTARQEFENHNLSHLVTVHHKDVCGKNGNGGFDLTQATVDAVVLDLPEPWLAVAHAAFCIKAGGRIACYSPCVEQSQKTIAALEKCGFHSIKTMEYRLREHYVDQVTLEAPPKELREGRGANVESSSVEHDDPTKEQEAKEDIDEVDSSKEDSQVNHLKEDKKRKRQDIESSGDNEPSENAKQILCARPFPVMRGHSAFLTFATAGNTPQPDPNIQSKKVNGN